MALCYGCKAIVLRHSAAYEVFSFKQSAELFQVGGDKSCQGLLGKKGKEIEIRGNVSITDLDFQGYTLQQRHLQRVGFTSEVM